MAVRKKIRHDDETRAKIQAAQIINRMQSCIMGEITLDASGKGSLNAGDTNGTARLFRTRTP